jgi:hypothetical protein
MTLDGRMFRFTSAANITYFSEILSILVVITWETFSLLFALNGIEMCIDTQTHMEEVREGDKGVKEVFDDVELDSVCLIAHVQNFRRLNTAPMSLETHALIHTVCILPRISAG